MKKLICLALGAGFALAAAAEAPEVKNGRLVDEDGHTLYFFAKDTVPGQSQCQGGCAKLWPAALADEYDKATGKLSLIPRDGGKRQWAYQGRPLYRYAQDAAPGEMKGDGYAGLWQAAKP